MSTNNRNLSMAEALREALYEEMKENDEVFLMGQDIGTPNGWGGPFTVCRGLVEEFGSERVRNVPISEKAIVGCCVGSAMMGMKPVGEVQYSDFLFTCMDEIVNEAAKMRYMSNGQYKVPMVFRAPTGATTRGAQHAQSPEGMFMHIPGLKVVAPSNAYDGKGLLKAAIRDDSPVLFFEHKLLYGAKNRDESDEIEANTHVPEDDYIVPLGKAKIKKSGNDITMISLLYTVHLALQAANILKDDGIDSEVIDLRSLAPLDEETIMKSVEKTKKVLIIEEDNKTLGWGAEIAALIAENFQNVKIKRVAALDVPIPFAPNLENYVIPNKENILNEVEKIFV